MGEFTCPHPDCEDSDRTFSKESHMKIHHSNKHGESIAKEESECPECGSMFEYYPSIKRGVLCSECIDKDDVCVQDFVENWDHTNTSKEISRECPECGKTNKITKFESEENENTFCGKECYRKYRRDNSSRVEISCAECSNTKIIPKNQYEKTEQNFCSPECMADSMRKERIKIECSKCGKEEKRRPSNVRRSSDSYYCSPECHRGNSEGKAEIICDNCGDKSERWSSKIKDNNHTFCGEDCRYEFFTTEDLDFNSYGRGFYAARRKVRERDNKSCQICGKSRSDLGIHPSAHHITPVKWFVNNGYNKSESNYVENLILLCRYHHRQVEYDSIELRDNIDDDLAEKLELEDPE